MLTPYSNIISVTTLEALLLDTYSGAAAAYSLRKLRSAYTGNAIRVRRASDNTEQNIGFVNNVLDTATLASFCSGTNGFVTTWYDQSGNGRDATQTTAINQPQIYDIVGGVIEVNSKPSLLFDGVNDIISTSIISGITNPNTHFFVFDKIGNVGNLGGIFNSASGGGILLLQTGGVVGYQQGPQFTPIYANNNQSLVTLKTSTLGTDWEMYGNATTIINSGQNIGTTPGNQIFLGGRGNITAFGNTYIQEYVFYNSNQISNRIGIETNINSFFNIYP